MNETIIADFREKFCRKSGGGSQSWSSVVVSLELIRSFNFQRITQLIKFPPVNTDVLPVSNVCEEDPCGVLISQLVLKIMQHSVQLNSSILNTSVGIEYEAVETSSINVVDQCGS